MNKNSSESTNDTIIIPIGTGSVNESNDFLRRLWGLLDQEATNAWCYTPNTNTAHQRVFIGKNNIGSFSFDYKEKGCINNIYISEYKLPREELIRIVDSAKKPDTGTPYYVECIYQSMHADFKVAKQCFTDVLTRVDENGTVIRIKISAFSDLDLKFWIRQKSAAIQFVLFPFTNRRFTIKAAQYSLRGCFEATEMPSYDYEWYDADECPQNDAGEYYLPQEFFNVISGICSSSFYDDFISAVVNASQMLYNAASLSELSFRGGCAEVERTGLFDMINASIVSSLEAILAAEPQKVERCTCCGQPKYSIVKRIYDLSQLYLGDAMAAQIKKRIYGNRSKYMHEGRTVTPLYRFQSCFPLIDPRSPREMLNAETPLEYNLIDYCAYIIRKFVYDHYNKPESVG